MRKIICILFMMPFWALGQSKKSGLDLNFTALSIPQDIKKDAHTVFRLDEGIVDVAGPGRYTFKVHQIYTILNKDGSHNLSQVHGIDKFHKIDDIEVKVLNQLGMEIQRFKKKDFTVTAAYDGISLVTDSKVMRLTIPASEYPVTLDVKYTQEVSSYINLPAWYFQASGVAVELSRFMVKVPGEMDIRHRAKNIKVEPVVTVEGNRKSYLWEIKNLQAKNSEAGAGEYAKVPKLLIGSNQFEYDGNKGTMSDWKSLGIWYTSLVKQTNQLSDNYKAEIQSLVSGISDDLQKVKILYAHLQKNFRYVSIQLGIGGFKPFPADFVHEKKYGDCKALSNYMQACLNAVNIKSYSALINAGEDGAPVDADFPYNGFNHVILCTPLNKDTVWLECTSKTVDFAHLSNFTENRNALLITENGGVLVPTPSSMSYQNSFNVNTIVDLQENGSGKISSSMSSTGEYKYQLLNYSQEKDDIKKNFFVSELGFPNPDEFEVAFGERTILPLNTKIDLTLQKVSDFVAGNKMFLKPRFCKIWSAKLPAANSRTEDYLFDCPMQKADTTILKLPTGYVSDALPKSKDLKCDYATYQTRYWYDEGKQAIYSVATLELKQHRIPAEKYSSVKSFFDEVLLDNTQRIVIRKQ